MCDFYRIVPDMGFPNLTKYEKDCVREFQEFLDGADYTEGAKWEVSAEQAVRYEYAFKVHYAEEIWDMWDDEQKTNFLKFRSEFLAGVEP